MILGRDGELFYSSTVEDYCGQGLSDGDLQKIAENLLKIQEHIEKHGMIEGTTHRYLVVARKPFN